VYKPFRVARRNQIRWHLLSYDIVRMLWWFLILAFSAGAVVWAGIAAYLRVRRHISVENAAKRDVGHEADRT